MGKRPLVLMVDDDADILALLGDLLRLEGFSVVGAEGGRRAFLLLRQWRPDLVLLDLVMNDIDGLQTLRLLRRCTGVPIIVVTACCEAPVLQQALELGADDFVAKPFGLSELLERIRLHLESGGGLPADKAT